MTSLKQSSRSRLASLSLIVCGALGSVAACSSDSGNAAPSNPVISTGGSSGNGTGVAGQPDETGTSGLAGSTGSDGGTTATGAAGAGGEGGTAGSNVAGEGPGTAPVTCPTTDVEFLNQASDSQTARFDNAKRLGTYSALPALQ